MSMNQELVTNYQVLIIPRKEVMCMKPDYDREHIRGITELLFCRVFQWIFPPWVQTVGKRAEALGLSLC